MYNVVHFNTCYMYVYCMSLYIIVLKSYREEPLYPSKDAGNQENYLKEQTMDLKKEVI